MARPQSSISNKNLQLQSSATAEQRGILTTINARNLSATSRLATSRFVHDRAIDHAAANRRRLVTVSYLQKKTGNLLDQPKPHDFP
ncbi:predicted protein [Histoplasma mississippiense (nom. inval.)]|uniref:predicted protein n=1 Tax=Ajellomyces capsulatus (strain NAm1 / WU24) TaxID=2059318 RepID=UPI000157D576|nr:predicted protein [Histoplasma mississippiense (nom. inval.)]EDN05137.1 predicted protein [Histoplasma mississippiense (nom. inval.)]